MSAKLQIVSFVLGVFFTLTIVYVIRKRKLSPVYSILWLFLSIFLLSVPLFEDFYVYLSRNYFGFFAEHIIYITVIGFLLLYILFLSSRIVRINDETRQLISYTSILEKKIRDIENKLFEHLNE